MAGHDLTHMSYNELQALGGQLYKAGVITGEQALDLTAPTLLPLIVDQDETQWRNRMSYYSNEKINVLAGLRTVLDSAKRSGDRSSIEHMEKVVNLATSLDAISRAS
jgi:hypothetical protein